MLEVWITDLSVPLPKHQYYELLTELSIDKQEKLCKYKYHEDALRSLLGDIMIRTMIYKYRLFSGSEIEFKMNKYGKPYLVNNANIHFNISHSENLVACAINDNSPIGIDIEYIKPIDLSIAKRFFTENEFHFIISPDDKRSRYQRFYYIWTRKEAYIKQQGVGLHIPLKSFDVLVNQNNVYFQCIYNNAEYICNICLSKADTITTYYISAQELFLLYNQYRFKG